MPPTDDRNAIEYYLNMIESDMLPYAGTDFIQVLYLFYKKYIPYDE